MNEVDSLSNSGLYPALPIADQIGGKDDSERRARSSPKRPDMPAPADAGVSQPPRPPKSLIDEYA